MHHVSLNDVSLAFVAFHGLVCQLYSLCALVEQIYCIVLIQQLALGESSVSSCHVKSPNTRMLSHEFEHVVQYLNAPRVAQLHLFSLVSISVNLNIS